MSVSRRFKDPKKGSSRSQSGSSRQPTPFSGTFRLIPKAAPEGDAVLIVGQDGSILEANKEAAAIFGPHAEDLRGMPFASPEDLVRRTEVEIVRDHRVCRAEMVVTDTQWEGKPAYRVTLVDVTQLWNLVEELALSATRDPLTKLHNRAAVMDRIEDLARPERSEPVPFAVVYIDLNDFKIVNDSYGHLAGDFVLTEVARRMQDRAKSGELLARIGGDEFLALLEGPDAAQRAQEFPNLVRDAFMEPFMVQGRPLYLGASCGAGVYPEDGKDGEELLAIADLRMYQVKGGQNLRMPFVPPATSEELARDILTGQLRIRCQPQIFFREKKAIAAEARCYWNHPRLGLVRAGSFLGVAEKSDLIVAVDEYVLNQACRLVGEWIRDGQPIKRLALNISAASLARPGLADVVGYALDQHAVRRGFIELEIPDCLELTDEVCSVLENLRKVGVRIAVDNFGSGPRSLQWVRELPVDTLKIDRGLVAGFLSRPTHRAMVEAFIQMGRALDFTVVAEGVEKMEEVEALQTLGCDGVQGFAISDALASDELAAFARRHGAHRRKASSPPPVHWA